METYLNVTWDLEVNVARMSELEGKVGEMERRLGAEMVHSRRLR